MITKEEILDDLERDRLPLPTLPEVALKVRETVDDEDATIKDVAQIIETDAVLSARIIQIANSALYRGLSYAENVQSATRRMGLNTVEKSDHKSGHETAFSGYPPRLLIIFSVVPGSLVPMSRQ